MIRPLYKPEIEYPVMDILFYESIENGTEESLRLIKDIFRTLERPNKYADVLVKNFKEAGLIGMEFSLRKSVLEMALCPHRVVKESVEKVPQESRYYLTTEPYIIGKQEPRIPGTFEQLKMAHDFFIEQDSLDMFVLNSHTGNGELAKIVENLDRLPLLRTCPWVALETIKSPLAPAVKQKVKEHGTVIPYGAGNYQDIAKQVAERIVKYFMKNGK
jgi:hypothetical protein